MPPKPFLLRSVLAALIIFAATGAFAQDKPAETPAPVIETDSDQPSDDKIAARIRDIFAELESLSGVTVDVNAGVVTLGGVTTTAEAASRAEALAARVAGVVTVENNVERDVSVSRRVAPALGEAQTRLRSAVRAAPLVLLAIAAFASIMIAGWLIARWGAFWRRVTPNAFIAELAQTSVRVVFFAMATIAALSLLDATPLLGAFLGAAGVLGLAVGFAIRDTIENYIASIMLSLRQPFRPNDLVVIDDREGNVVRLTSRATILMTPDGNHLRIPNATVFKAVILNYTRNPERRFKFTLGIAQDEDPLAALEPGVAALAALDFTLQSPRPIGLVEEVGDSSIVLFFAAWIDQRNADFAKSQSAAVAAVVSALDGAGIDMPEPGYRIRVESAETPPKAPGTAQPEKQPPAQDAASADTAPQTHIAEMVEEERRETGESDLLDRQAPVE